MGDLDDLDALLEDALDDFQPEAKAPAPSPAAAAADAPMDLQHVAQGLRALVGEMDASEFQPRLETLVRQVERLAAEPVTSPAQTASASSTARAEDSQLGSPIGKRDPQVGSPAPAPAKSRGKKATSPKKKTKGSQLAAPTPAPAPAMQDLPPELANMPPEFMAMIQKLEDDMKASGVDPEQLAQNPEAMGQMLQQMMGGEGAMQDMMSQMMSKDVLAEPMKQLEKLYPPWFGTHASELSKEELARYKKQYKIVQKLVQQFENEPDDADKIAQMMQEMHDCGQPPAEIIKQLSPDMEVGPDGQPVLPKGPNGEECTVQ